MDLFFDTEAILDLSYFMLRGSLGISENNGNSVWNLAAYSELRRFTAFSTRFVDRRK